MCDTQCISVVTLRVGWRGRRLMIHVADRNPSGAPVSTGNGCPAQEGIEGLEDVAGSLRVSTAEMLTFL